MNRTDIDLPALAHNIDKTINHDVTEPDNGFALLVFDYRNHGDVNVGFISNARQDAVVMLLKAFIARIEGRYISEGGHA